MSFQRFFLFLVSLLALQINLCLADAGDLDLTFGDGGKVISDLKGPGSNGAYDAAVVQPDGKIVVVGSNNPLAINVGTHFVLARYNTDGTLDEGFGTNGIVSGDTGYIGDGLLALAIQGDGKIVAGGATRTPEGRIDFLVTRFSANGSLDTGFGDNGIVIVDIDNSSIDTISAIAIQDDGRIVAMGNTANTDLQRYSFALVRFRTDGSLDRGFGQGGIVIADFDSFSKGDNTGGDMVLQPDGKILAAGWIALDTLPYYNTVVVRYMPDGSVDTSFGTNGVTTLFGNAVSIVLHADGRILVAGYYLNRLYPDGTLDTSFGTDGYANLDLGPGFEAPKDINIQDNGSIVVGGWVWNYFGPDNQSIDFMVERILPDGSPDTSFGTNGQVTTDFDNQDDKADTVLVQSDGKIVLVGRAYVTNPEIHISDEDFALVRYLPDGSPDPTFGSDGKVRTDIFGPVDNGAQDVAIVQADGKIVVGGGLNVLTDIDFAIARYLPDGRLDTDFGNQGRVTTDFGSVWADYVDEFVAAIALQADGKILAAGPTQAYDYHQPVSTNFALVRYNTDGSLDLSFGDGGKVITEFATLKHEAYATSMVLQPDGKIVVAGHAWADRTGPPWPPFEFALARYLPDGNLDTSFGDGGKVLANIEPNHNDYLENIALQPDGKIVAAGYYVVSSGPLHGYNSQLARFNANGSLDESFGDGGKIILKLSEKYDWLSAVAVRPDGRIVVGGSLNSHFLLMGFNPDGSFDNSFGNTGLVTTSIGINNEAVEDITLQIDGRIIAAGPAILRIRDYGPDWVPYGPASLFHYETDFALVRYNTDGSLDYGFGNRGRVTTDFGDSDTPFGIVLQADGKIIVAGETWTRENPDNSYYGHWDIALARYEGVTTRSDELERVVSDVQNLAATDVLSLGQALPLQELLQAAILAVDGGNDAAAIRQLGTFLRRIDFLVAQQVLTPDQGQSLIDEVQVIIDKLGA